MPTVSSYTFEGGGGDPQAIGNVTVGTGDYIVAIGWRYSGGDTINAINVGGVALTPRGSSTYAGNPYGAYDKVWTGAPGTVAVEIDAGTGGSNLQAIVLVIPGGIGNVSSITFADQAGGSGISLTVPSTPGDTVFVIGTDGFNGTTLTVTSGGTNLGIAALADRFAISQAASAGVSTTVTATAPGNQYRAIGISVSDAAMPTISGVSNSTPKDGVSVTLTGTNYGASQGAGVVKLGGQVQAVTSWGDTSITVTVARGLLKYGSQSFTVTNNSGSTSSGFAVTFTQPDGWAYVDLTSVNGSAEKRLRTSPDLAVGDQILYATGGGLVISNDATFSWVAGAIRSFDAQVWTAADGWGGIFTQYLDEARAVASTWAALGLAQRLLGLRRQVGFDVGAVNSGAFPLSIERYAIPELTLGGGGSAYAVSQVETVSAADSLAAAAAWLGALTETAAAADGAAAAMAALATALESTSAADLLAAALVGGIAISESASATDAVAAGGTSGVSLVEAAAVADAITSGPVLVGAVNEALTAADVVAAVAQAAAQLTEAATAADVVAALSVVGAVVVETATAADLVAALLAAGAALTEAATLGEQSSTGPVVSASLAEAAAAADAASAGALALAAQAETAAAADAPVSQAARTAALIESATAADASSAGAPGTYSVAVAEAVGLGEVVVAVLGGVPVVLSAGRRTVTFTSPQRAEQLATRRRPRNLQ